MIPEGTIKFNLRPGPYAAISMVTFNHGKVLYNSHKRNIWGKPLLSPEPNTFS